MQRRIEVIERKAFKYHGDGFSASYLTLYGACKRWAEELVELQYAKRRRCVCGRRDKFCEFWHSDLLKCKQNKARRVMRIAKRIYRNEKKKAKGDGQAKSKEQVGEFKPRDVYAAHGKRASRKGAVKTRG